MGMVVRTNVPAINANRQLGVNSNLVSKSLEKLSSGFKINRAADDASGLAISEKMKAQIKGLETASANSQDGISLIQTAEGGAQEIHDMLNRMTELATKSANGTIQNDVDREAIQREVDDLNSEITRISKATNFNGINLLDGSLGGGSVSADGATFNGSNIAKIGQGKIETASIKDKDMNKIDITKANQDILSVDGQKVVIDWSKTENAGTLAALDTDLSAITNAQGKDIAKKLTETINNAMKDQGVNGSVTVSYDNATNKLTFKSDNKTAASEFSYIGTQLNGAKVADADAATGVMNMVVNSKGSTLEAANGKAALEYNGETIAAADKFQMTINGVTVSVAGPVVAKGATMDTAATALEGVLQAAIADYNKAVDSTSNPDLGLTDTEFEVSAGKDGGFVVKYTGDQKVNFSFKDVGDTTTAAKLGLAGGSSTSGGAGGLTLQIGDTGDSFNKVTVSVDDLSAVGIGTNGLNVATQDAAAASITTIKSAINQVSTNRANLGSLQNRLEHTINNLDTTAENMTAANSRIRDTDMAKEMMNYTKMNVLVQSAQAMLAQANQQPQSILQLLQ